jgi:hypothetical protein
VQPDAADPPQWLLHGDAEEGQLQPIKSMRLVNGLDRLGRKGSQPTTDSLYYCILKKSTESLEGWPHSL